MNRDSPTCAPADRSRPQRIKDWKAAGSTDHFVQFYRTEDYLIECLAGYVGEGIWNRDANVVIATPEHRIALEDRLRSKGIDVIATTLSRQLLTFDARELLGKFMTQGRPERELFMKSVGDIVHQATANGRRLRAFGEMVALLWRDGNRDGAIALEHLWNDLMRERAFALFCAYPAAGVNGKADEAALSCVCDAHAAVISLTA